MAQKKLTCFFVSSSQKASPELNVLSESDVEVVSEERNCSTEDDIEPRSSSTAVSGSTFGSDDCLQQPKACQCQCCTDLRILTHWKLIPRLNMYIRVRIVKKINLRPM